MVIKTQNCSLFITGITGCFFNFGHFMSKGLLFIKMNKLGFFFYSFLSRKTIYQGGNSVSENMLYLKCKTP